MKKGEFILCKQSSKNGGYKRKSYYETLSKSRVLKGSKKTTVRIVNDRAEEVDVNVTRFEREYSKPAGWQHRDSEFQCRVAIQMCLVKIDRETSKKVKQKLELQVKILRKAIKNKMTEKVMLSMTGVDSLDKVLTKYNKSI